MCTVNPWPSLEEWIVPCSVEPLKRAMEASGLDEETDGTILGFVTWSRVLPSENGKSRRPVGIGMLPVNTEAAVFALLLDETRTVSLEVVRIPPGCMEGDYSPSRR